MTPPQRARSHSYLLRCWTEAELNSGLTFWHFSLEDLRTGQRRGLASLIELVMALQDEWCVTMALYPVAPGYGRIQNYCQLTFLNRFYGAFYGAL